MSPIGECYVTHDFSKLGCLATAVDAAQCRARLQPKEVTLTRPPLPEATKSKPPSSVCYEPHASAQHNFLTRQLQTYHLRIAQIHKRSRPSKWIHLECRPPTSWALLASISASPSALRLHVTYSLWSLKDRHRADGVVATLLHALTRSAAEVHARVMLMDPPQVELYLTLSDSVPSVDGALLPHLSMAMSDHGSGLAVPDWTFAHNNELNASWTSALTTLGNLSRSLGPPSRRAAKIMWRGSPHNQPFLQAALPYEQRYRRRLALEAVERLERLGTLAALNLSADVTCWRPESCAPTAGRKLSWARMCESRYMLHLDGFGYSNSLRNRLACGSIVLRPRSLEAVGRVHEQAREWWEAVKPLTDGVEYIPLEANMTNLEGTLYRLEGSPGRARRVQKAALAYVRDYLSADAIVCYWRSLILAYSDLFDKWRVTCQRHVERRGSHANAGGSAAPDLGYVSNPRHERLKPHCYPGGANPCFRQRQHQNGAFNVTARIVPLAYKIEL